MDIIKLITDVKMSEGLRLNPYKDHLGNWTIGYGTTHWLGFKVTKDWKEITLQKAEAMLYAQLIWSIEKASKSVNNWASIGDTRQRTISEVIYQIGGRGWMKFAKTRSYIEDSDWANVHDEFLDSKLAEQTPGRANKYANMLFYGNSYT